ncbi:MAG TPA: DNA translocase FtsK [Burkholderiales bacterium]|nr:DNA translocase FtsK [Burkholderiales bacterium]
MQRRELEAKADAIEMILHEHKAPGRVTGGHVTPRWVQFLLQTNPGVKISRVESLSREIAVALGAPSARVTTQGNAVRIEVPRSDPQPLKLFSLSARIPPSRIPFGTAVLGLADDGAPLLIRLPSPDVAHVLVAGTTGSGKTALLQTIIMSLALLNHRRQMQFVLIDPKGRAFEPMAGLPHLLRPLVTQSDQAVRALMDLVNLMEQRDRSRVTDPRVIVAIDELADLVQTGGPAILESLARLVQRGREAGIHVIGATQKPSSAVIGPLVKANFPVRLVGRVVSAEDARVAGGIGGTGAEKLTGRGDFVAVYGPGLIRFQAAYISVNEIEAAVRQLAQGTRGDEIVQCDRPMTARFVPRTNHALSVLDSAVYALPGIER